MTMDISEPSALNPAMSTKQPESHSLGISPDKLLAFARAMIGGSKGREDDEHPLPPGPWDPVIRVALERVILARHPEASDAFGGGHRFGDEVALNPQPLPPRVAFLLSVAQAVIGRAELLQEIADATRRSDEQQGIIIVGGYTSRFCDEWCGNGFRLKYPLPGP